jgi:cation transport ATPase
MQKKYQTKEMCIIIVVQRMCSRGGHTQIGNPADKENMTTQDTQQQQQQQPNLLQLHQERLIQDSTKSFWDSAQATIYVIIGFISVTIISKISDVWTVDVMFLALLIVIWLGWHLIKEAPLWVISMHPQKGWAATWYNLFGIPSNLILQLVVQYAITLMGSLYTSGVALNAVEGTLLIFWAVMAIIFFATRARVDEAKHKWDEERKLRKKQLKRSATANYIERNSIFAAFVRSTLASGKIE